jgi:predicted amidophosphoribosyltransferase
MTAVMAYEGAGRSIVLALKRGNHRALVPALGAALAAAAPWPADPAVRTDWCVTWVPTSRRRRCSRGFDQAELLARHVARQLRLPGRALLERSSHDPPQEGRSAAERRRGPSVRSSGRATAGVLVVDDVVTTGGSMAAAGARLREAGAIWVGGVAVATVLKGSTTWVDT